MTAAYSGTYVSCGVGQLYTLTGMYELLRPQYLMMALRGVLGKCACTSTIVFSDADYAGNGRLLAADIATYLPKSTLVSVKARNPNSGNVITTWLWRPDWNEIAEWLEAGIKGHPPVYEGDLRQWVLRAKATHRTQNQYGAFPE